MSENIIRFILLLIGSVIILGILWDGLRRKKRRVLGMQEQIALRETLDDSEEYDDEDSDEVPSEEYSDEEYDEDEKIEKSELKDEAYDNENEIEETFEAIDEKSLETFQEEESHEEKPTSVKKPDFISVRVMARPDHAFGGYDLLQFLLANRLDYGEMKLFHRYADTERKEKLFSLASMNEPGDFELSKMNDFECDGLILYMHPKNHQDPLSIFDSMLDTAYDLAQDLRGELMSGQNQHWTDSTSEEIRKTLS